MPLHQICWTKYFHQVFTPNISQKYFHRMFHKNLSPSNFTEIFTNICSMGGVSQQDTKHHFTKGGRLVANKQIVYTIVEDRGLQPVSVAQDDVEVESSLRTILWRRMLISVVWHLIKMLRSSNPKISWGEVDIFTLAAICLGQDISPLNSWAVIDLFTTICWSQNIFSRTPL